MDKVKSEIRKEDEQDMPSSDYDSDDSNYVAWRQRKAKRIQIQALKAGSSLVEKPNFKPEELEQLVHFVRRMTTLYDLRNQDWNDECIAVIEKFMCEPEEPVLTVYFEAHTLKCLLGFPTIPITDLSYFFREDNVILTPDNFHDEVTFGTVDENIVGSILQVVENVYAPMFFQVTKWPDTVKAEFCSRLHTFLGNVTDFYYKMLGLSVLYIPREGVNVDVDEVAKDRELVKRLESVVVHWTRQIRTAIGDHSQISPNELLCPVDEYDFWIYRHENLNSLHYQIQNPHLHHICNVLISSQSTYHEAFKDLCVEIEDNVKEAYSNIQFLKILKEPCTELENVNDPTEIPPLLPKILQLFRVIWVNSPYYNSTQRITGLCKALSNQIIIFCKNFVDLDMVFEGKTRASIKMFLACIKALDDYKLIYAEIAKAHNTLGNLEFLWNLDEKVIFSNVDAFIFRCKDMIEVCETMIVFGRFDETDPIPRPRFGGQRGPEFEKTCEKVEEILKECVENVKKVQSAILDVQNTIWFDEILKYRIRMKECEVIIENLMIGAFEVLYTIDQVIETLGYFHNYSQNTSLKFVYNKKTEQLYQTFSEIIQEQKNDICTESEEYAANLPYYAGRAIKISLKKFRAETLKTKIDEAVWLSPCASTEEVFNQYANLIASMTAMIKDIYEKWVDSIGDDIGQRLKRPLLCKSLTHPGLYEVNFDRGLHDILIETGYWEQLGFDISMVAPVYKKLSSIRFVYESMVQVCIGYNKILRSLSDHEQQLYRYPLTLLEKKIAPGLNTLDWTHSVQDTYLKEVVTVTDELQDFLDDYKKCNMEIVKICEKICDTSLIKITPNYAFDLHELIAHMDRYRNRALRDLAHHYRGIIEFVIVIFEGFEPYIANMGMEWIKFVLRYDNVLETAIRNCVKDSLQTMYEALHGDGSSAPTPLLKLTANLKHNVINFEPSVSEVASMINNILPSIIESIAAIPRLAETFHLPGIELAPFNAVIKNDEECKRLQTALCNEVTFNVGEIQNYKKVWDPFVEIWQVDKDRFIERYEQQRPNASAFDSNIGRYTEVANNASIQETVTPVNFLVVNSAELKKEIINHCFEWQSRLCELLTQMTIRKIDHIYEYTEQNKEQIAREPKTLAEMQAALEFFEKVQAEVPIEEAEFPSIEEQMRVMDKYLVELDETFRVRQQKIPTVWLSYLSAIEDAKAMLFKVKEDFKNDILRQAMELRNACVEFYDWFYKNAPFTAEFTATEALGILVEINDKLESFRVDQENLKKDLAIFHISQSENSELQKVDKDYQALKIVWELTDEWDNHWEQYKTGEFWKIEVFDMEEVVNGLFKKLTRLSKELREKNWPIIDHSKHRVEAVRKVLPLIGDLKNPAMRDRHWDRVKTTIGRDFDQHSPEFTLELVLAMEMQNFTADISEISQAATGELAIENGLKLIADTWDKLQIFWTPGKDSGSYKLKSMDDAAKALEENVVSLSVMKSTKYIQPFQKTVDTWERTLSYISEVMEMVLNVQRQYLYMENIFSSDDIRKQLPKEAAEFDGLRHEWKDISSRMNAQKNCMKACTYRPAPFLLNKLNKMTEKMEILQRALEVYLETKRHIFPRFYFISNDDLLEILGNAKKPELVQPHLKKLFDNLVKLKLNKHGIHMEALGMSASDGEYIDFIKKLTLDGPVEIWLNNVQDSMRACLREQMRQTKNSLKKMLDKRDKWLMMWPGQCGLTNSLMQWTADCSRALTHCKLLETKKPLRKLRKKQSLVLAKLSEVTRKDLPKLARNKTNALITVEIHSRDVIDQMYKAGCMDINAFEWFSQLRFYWERDIDDVMIRQTNTKFLYFYEYLGNSGRLVITPLTDRCYITLTTALHLYRGGSPKGPAGTGKTETVKDLGKALGEWVIVINCSEGLDYRSLGKMFSGLSQSGTWGCFDEFNRINIEVLSVVAQQIMSILTALASKQRRFVFEGTEIGLEPTAGFFITMNPGYAGRTELPDNLKSMFRPISMMTPDSAIIAENLLFSDGFAATRSLSKKVNTLYQLAMQQLSKQDHYDFGLRSMVALLRYAGRKRRDHPDLPEEQIVYLAMADMNIAKLTSDDLPLFTSIMSDIFPNVDIPHIDYDEMIGAMQETFKELNVQPIQIAITKVIQLYETKCSRHSVMILGSTCTAKTVTWKSLKGTLTRLAQAGKGSYVSAMEYPMNPKSLSLGELYGEYNLATGEWLDGVLSNIMRTVCADENPDQKWILFDGPVDAVWIENMNSVMDDNKILTLINSERITMPEQVSLLFEVGDLSVASPATVSRCGMVYNDYKDWGWRPYVASWITTIQEPAMQTELNMHFEYYIDIMLETKKKCTETVPIPELNLIISLCRLLECFATPANGCDTKDQDGFKPFVKLWFLYCMIWSVCITVTADSRKKFDAAIRELESVFPLRETVYEYYVDVRARTFMLWESKLNENWSYSPELPFYDITVPTIDTIRYDFLMSPLLAANYPILVTGPVGTGKTNTINTTVSKQDEEKFSNLVINMSAMTTSTNVQDMIESRLEKRTKLVYVPPGNKNLIVFLDDLNMPAKDTYGSQPPLELLRLWVGYGFWYDRQKQWRRYVQNMQLVAAMGPPGGGRTFISDRFMSKFNIVNMIFPEENSIKRIYGTMLRQQLKEFDNEIKAIANTITEATIDMYKNVCARMLPTPAKMHYLFNLRDISRVFQGLLRSHKDYQNTTPAILRLWIHESYRVFYDRLIDEVDQAWLTEEIHNQLGRHFEVTLHSLCPNKESPIFGDFMNQHQIYDDLTDLAAIRKHLENQLREYNQASGTVRMDIVLFKYAIEHACKIIRVISQPRGNVLLVGVGGSGRQSMSRLSAFICDCGTFQIEVIKEYGLSEFKEDLKRLYKRTGVELRNTCFLFNDTQVAVESFLEIVNNMLSSGEVAGLFKKDELEDIKTSLERPATKEGIKYTTEAMYNFFIHRVRSTMHIILCMSPIGEAFRNRLRQYPSIVNSTTIDWFLDWPVDALLEVAYKGLRDVDFVATITGEKKLRGSIIEGQEDLLFVHALTQEECLEAVASVFSIVHSSVANCSRRMLLTLKRYNYVTPTNYLELVEGYKRMLAEKRMVKIQYSAKLRSGVGKIEDTRDKVEVMTQELEVAKAQIIEYTHKCDEVLVVIQSKKHEADEEAKEVAAKSVKIGVEEKACKKLADSAQVELDLAMPALNEAIIALDSLNKKDITEIRSYTKPPQKIEMVLEAVMILKGVDPTWTEAKKQLADLNFLDGLRNFDKNNITDKVTKKISRYTALDDFQPDKVGTVSLAAKSLCMWVIAIEKYARVWKVVAPKKARLDDAMASLTEKRNMLAAAKAKLQQLNDMLQELQRGFEEKMKQKEELNQKAEVLRLKLYRASLLLDGLSGEKVRWAETINDLDVEFDNLPGDCLLSTAFTSYVGPFVSSFREELLSLWQEQVTTSQIPFTTDFDIVTFLVDPTIIREWNIQGLPSDNFSTENGIIVSRGTRWPLIIDPQCQAVKWIRFMEASKDLKIIDFGMTNYVHILEVAVITGKPVLLQNVGETLEAALNPILNRAYQVVGGKTMIKFNDKLIHFNKNFRFYIATKLPNPHYAPEISTKTTLVNFAVKEQGLEAQLLGIVVRKEKPTLEEQKDQLVMTIATGRRTLIDLETELLKLLYESEGSLLDNLVLINTLQVSKKTSAEVIESLRVSEITEVEIDEARELYRTCARRASIIFFVLNDLGRIDPMYQFSLDSYIHLFLLSIVSSPKSADLDTRLVNLNDYHTYAVYKNTCRALFERHKLLFSFHMCMKILAGDKKLNLTEYLFVLKGGIVLNKENQPDNPAPKWITDESWDNITEFDKLPGFHGIISSFEQFNREWHDWYISTEPENTPLVGEWNDNCNEFQRIIFIRCLRPDRIYFVCTQFIINSLGQRFAEPPVLDIKSVHEESLPQTPLIFVLSAGVDPTGQLLNLADTMEMTDNFASLSLGQGQSPIATKMIAEGIRDGTWVYLANCHLSLSWMPALDKIVENLQTSKVHKRFRLWLSSSPSPEFPLSILQNGIKMTTEPPKGIKANLKRMYNIVTDEQFAACQAANKYKKLLFALCFFHSVLIERKKFQQLGWNVIYAFNDSDFDISQTILSIYLDEYPVTPWDALKYLVAGVNYGGHVTDDWDRRLLTTYINQYFNETALNTPLYRLSTLPTYYIPKDGSLESYQDYITILPNIDRPEAFGQHPNADITSQISETREMLGTLLSLEVQIASGDSSNLQIMEAKVVKVADEILVKAPKMIDYDHTFKNMGANKQPLDVVLLQEIVRYNKLLASIKKSLEELKRGISGFIVMSAELEEIFTCLDEGRVPNTWLKTYPSLKGLGAWTRDLIDRVEFFTQWAVTLKQPLFHWLAAYTFPTGFLTAVLQTAARLNVIPIDTLSWEFNVFTAADAAVVTRPDVGVFVKTTFLEGAGWNFKHACLEEAEPMKLIYKMPTIHFKPTEAIKKRTRGIYSCPCYYFPIRAGAPGRAAFVIAVDLKSGNESSDFWIKRGTALLLSLGN